jgi:hypothetical protein
MSSDKVAITSGWVESHERVNARSGWAGTRPTGSRPVGSRPVGSRPATTHRPRRHAW